MSKTPKPSTPEVEAPEPDEAHFVPSKRHREVQERNAEEAHYLSVMLPGETEFRPIQDIVEENRALREAMAGGPGHAPDADTQAD